MQGVFRSAKECGKYQQSTVQCNSLWQGLRHWVLQEPFLECAAPLAQLAEQEATQVFKVWRPAW